MRHSKVENWSPDVLAQSGLFGGMHEWPSALLDAPVVILQPHEPLVRSRSGEALAMFLIAGQVRRRTNDMSETYREGAFFGVRELVNAGSDAAEVVAISESVVILLDRHRILALCEASPAFALQIVAAMLHLAAGAGSQSSDHSKTNHLPIDGIVPAGLHSIVLVRLENRATLELCHGHEIGRNAIRAIGRAVDLSTRPDDARTFLGENEFLIAIEGDRLAASIIATRLIARCSRIVAIPDLQTQLPHLHVVIGLSTVEPGEMLAAVVSRARAAASKASQDGEIFGG